MSAVISADGRYRYLLTRDVMSEASPHMPPVVFICLNPSKADANVNDPTIRRMMGFARDWGSAGIIVANLYAYRATDPTELWKVEDPVGPLNDATLRRIAQTALADGNVVVAGWGTNARPDRAQFVCELFRDAGVQLHTLGLTLERRPKHPLYLKKTTRPVPWNPC